jgi:3'(2'), 5'-bisphosphate nucleotidase
MIRVVFTNPGESVTEQALTDDQLAGLLPGVLEVVAAASKAILEVYAGAHEVEYKEDDSPLTRADKAAHEILAAGLARLTPSLPVLSEESQDSHDFAIRGAWRNYWLVDPLDGTKEFINRNGEFTVNVALVRDHRPVLGFTYSAVIGKGAYKTEAGGKPAPISVRPAGTPLIVVGSRSHRGDTLDAVLQRLGPHEMRPMGSARKICLVAEGAADFYPRLGLTSEWDTAAAQAVLEIAGGQLTMLDGRPLRYNERKDTLLNPHFMAFGDSSRDWAALF